MAEYEVTAPDGRTFVITAPEGATQAQALAYAKSQFGKMPKPEPSFVAGVAQGIMDPINNLAGHLERGANAIGVGPAISRASRALGMSGTVDEAKAAQRQAMSDRGVEPSTGGRIVGNIIGTLPTAAIPGALAQGAVSGAVLSEGQDLGSVATDAAIGAAAGKVGEALVGGVSRAISPKVAPVVQRLKDQGIPMTLGQIVGTGGIVGKAVKGVEDRAAGIPIVGDMVNMARRKGVEAFNKTAVNRALAPVGKALPDDVPLGHDAIKYAGDQLSNEYRALVPKLSAKLDKTFATRIAATTKGAGLSDDMAARFEQIIQRDVGGKFNPDGTITGKNLKALDEKLGDYASGWKASGDPDQRALGEAVSELRGHVQGLVRRANPNAAAKLRKINEGWANLVRVESAAKNSTDGLFSPAQLRTAVRQSDKSARKRAVSRGTALMQDLARDGSEVLPSNVPDSGTMGRLALGLAGAGAISPQVAIAGGAAMLPYAPGVRKGVEWALTGRQGAGAKSLAQIVRRAAPAATLAAPPLLQRIQD